MKCRMATAACWFLPLLGLSACAGRVRPPRGHDLARAGCSEAPLVLVFGVAQPECNAGPGKSGVLSISLQGPLPSLGSGTLPISAQGTTTALWCRSQNAPCHAAIAGHLTVNGVDDGIAISGEYSVEFQDGTQLSAPFGAEWCPSIPPCGGIP
jgi:hypothetical protein